MTWPIKKLGEIIFDIKDGGTPSRNQPEYFGGNINWCVVNDIQDEIWQTREKLTELGLKNSSAKVWPIDSVIISLGATIGNVGVAKIPIATKQGLAGMVVDKKQARPKYIAYILQSKKNYIQSLARGVTIKEIRPAQFARIFTLPLPPLPIQKKIVARLDAIQEAMKKNDELIEKTEELFRAITHNEFNSTGKGWKINKLKDLIEDIKIGPFGSALKIAELSDKGPVRVLFIENIVNNVFDWSKEKFISEEKYKELTAYTVKPDDILVTMMGTVGRTSVTPENIGRAIISSHLIKITLNQKMITPEFLNFSLRDNSFITNQILRKAKGAIMKGLNSTILKKLDIPTPPLKIQQQIVAKLDSVLEYKRALRARKAQLKELFDSTLAKSMKGEMDK